MTPALPPSFPGRAIEINGRYVVDTGPSAAGWHELSEFVLCPQRWAYQHLLQLERKAQDYFDRGSLFHGGAGAAACQAWAIQNGYDPRIFWEPHAAVHLLAQQLGRLDLEQPVSVAVGAYVEHVLKPWFADWNVIGVELEAVVEIDGKPLTRGIDLVVQHKRTMHVRIADHKSRSGHFKRHERAYENDLTLDYLWRWGSTAYGALFDGVILSYVDLPKAGSRPVTLKMEQVQTKRSPWREDQMGDTVRYYRGQLDALLESGLDPWRWPKAQTGFGPCGDCAFLDYCRFGPPRTAITEKP